MQLTASLSKLVQGPDIAERDSTSGDVDQQLSLVSHSATRLTKRNLPMLLPTLPALPDSPWAAAFGSELNSGQQSVTAAVGNGAFNSIGGSVTTIGQQDVGDGF